MGGEREGKGCAPLNVESWIRQWEQLLYAD